METKNKSTEVITNELEVLAITPTSEENTAPDAEILEIAEVTTDSEALSPIQPLDESEPLKAPDEIATSEDETVAKARKPRSPAKKKPDPIGGKAKIKLGAFIDDGNELVKADMPIAIQNAEVTKMNANIKKKTICQGKIFGVEESAISGILILLKSDNLRVMIPATDFFAKSTMKSMEGVSREESIDRYRQKAVRMYGAAISFIPKAMGVNTDGVPFVIASRKDAMEKMQERYFFGSKPIVEVNNLAKASIISVSPKNITVECLGVETVIGTGRLSAFKYIEDATKDFRKGDGLMVAVEKLDVDKENRKVDITFSHALVERAEANVEEVSDSMLQGRYMAVVIAVLENYYIVIVTGLKIRGLIPKKDYVGTEPLINGDVVSMFVTGIDKEKSLVIGRCMKTS